VVLRRGAAGSATVTWSPPATSREWDHQPRSAPTQSSAIDGCARLLVSAWRFAAYGWDTMSVEVLLRRLSAAMADEVEHLVAFDTLV
jgi:hypothetical protein